MRAEFHHVADACAGLQSTADVTGLSATLSLGDAGGTPVLTMGTTQAR